MWRSNQRSLLKFLRQSHSWAKGGEKPNVAIAGVTGAVGEEFLRCLEQRNFPMNSIKGLASARSIGKSFTFKNQEFEVQELTHDSFHDVDIALFSAGGSQSKLYAPSAVDSGALVIDNSSAYRMDPDVPLVVPEVNPEAAFLHKGIIANPNCSTIIMAVPLWPIHKLAGIERVVVSTYQAASGAGAAAMKELEQQAIDWAHDPNCKFNTEIFGRQYLWNLFSHNASVTENGYNEEEVKMMRETKKIFNDELIKVSATCIRVPVLRAHCESINVTLRTPLTEEQIRNCLQNGPGLKIIDDRQNNHFPEPIHASGEDEIFVGRIREDESQIKGIGYDMFVAGDQLLKGAALNAVQIAELFLKE